MRKEQEDAINDAIRAQNARADAERAERETASKWPKVHQVVQAIHAVHDSNHFGDAIKSIFRST